MFNTMINKLWSNTTEFLANRLKSGTPLAAGDVANKAYVDARTFIPTPAVNPVYCYIRSTGSDSNDGLTEATAKLTLFRAWTTMSSYEFLGRDLIIDIGPGTFTSPELGTCLQTIRQLNGCPSVTLQGAGKDVTTLAAMPGLNAGLILTTLEGLIFFNIYDLRITSDFIPIYATNTTALLQLDRVILQKNTLSVTTTDATYLLNLDGVKCYVMTLTLRGSATIGIGVTNCSWLHFGKHEPQLHSLTIEGNPNFSDAFMVAGGIAGITIPIAYTITGAVTGRRYIAGPGSFIHTVGMGENRIPGTLPGEVYSTIGGFYD
jgi:hypothetical protein